MALLDIFKKKPAQNIKAVRPAQKNIEAGREEKKKSEKKAVKKEIKKKAERKPAPVKVAKKEPAFAEASAGKEKIEPQAIKPKKKLSGKGYEILYSPHITEKATDFEKENKYIFKVFSRSNKIEIKKAVRDIYGVDVVNVRIINIPRRKKRLGKYEGWEKGYKKAIVKIKQGQKIEILPR